MRRPPKALKVFFAAFPFFSLLFFPWHITLVTALAAGFVFPPLALIAGILVDVLYYPGASLPLGTLAGAFLCAFSYGVRRFIETRIM